MPAPLNPHRARLAGRLKELRAATGLSGNRFARRIGWVQSRVSKLETGFQIPTDDDLRQWIGATGAGAAEFAELGELLTRARVEYATWRDVDQAEPGGLVARQAAYQTIEGRSRYAAYFQPAMLPGLVQTGAYARELLRLPGGPVDVAGADLDLEAMVGQRIRRQEVLYAPGHRIEIVVGEAALRSPPGSRATMAAQLDRLVVVSELAGVDIRITPLDSPLPILPVSGFSILDGVVYIETLTGEQVLHAPEETRVYIEAFERLREAAAHDDAAVAIIHDAQRRIRKS